MVKNSMLAYVILLIIKGWNQLDWYHEIQMAFWKMEHLLFAIIMLLGWPVLIIRPMIAFNLEITGESKKRLYSFVPTYIWGESICTSQIIACLGAQLPSPKLIIVE